jgi:hypothetical protein
MTSGTVTNPPPEPRLYSPLAAFLSYLVPGLGQISQGRIGKGVLFIVCLYGLFFCGMAMGGWQNVYIAQTAKDGTEEPAWENNSLHLPKPVANLWNRLHFVGQFWIGAAAWPAIWQYNDLPVPSEQTSPFLHKFQRAPTPKEENEINEAYGKVPDIAWVYTVIAGVLNILVIYDALAGPALAAAPDPAKRPAAPAAQEAAPV